jgi:hypothetical protein
LATGAAGTAATSDVTCSLIVDTDVDVTVPVPVTVGSVVSASGDAVSVGLPDVAVC